MHSSNWRGHLRDYIDFLEQKYALSPQEIRQELLAVRIPAGIYNSPNTPLQVTAKYLQAEKNYTLPELAETLNRTPAEVKQLLKKTIGELGKPTGPRISTAVFSDRALSASEHLVEQLDAQAISTNEIAEILGKDPQTIYTLRRRAQQKRGETQ